MGIGEAAATTSPTGTSSPLATQDAIGALTFRVQTAGRTGAATGPMVLAPPRVWSAEGIGARALLATAGRLIEQGGLAPRGLVDMLRSGQGITADRALDYPAAAGGREVAVTVVDGITRDGTALADLVSAADNPDPGTVGIGPEEAFTPVRRGLVRPVSAALRGSPAEADAVAEAEHATDRGAPQPDQRAWSRRSRSRSARSDAPLPLTIVNGLPVPVRVRVERLPHIGPAGGPDRGAADPAAGSSPAVGQRESHPFRPVHGGRASAHTRRRAAR